MKGNYAEVLESYLIPAEEGFFSNIFGIFGISEKKYSTSSYRDKIKMILTTLKNFKFKIQKSIPKDFEYSIPDDKKSKIENINGYDVILYTSNDDASFNKTESFGVLILMDKKSNKYDLEKFSLDFKSVKRKISGTPNYKTAIALQNSMNQQQMMQQQNQAHQLAMQQQIQAHTMGVNAHALATFGHTIM